jgi:hypothetical protein
VKGVKAVDRAVLYQLSVFVFLRLASAKTNTMLPQAKNRVRKVIAQVVTLKRLTQ